MKIAMLFLLFPVVANGAENFSHERVNEFKERLYQGCMNRGAQGQLDSAKVEAKCDCILQTLEAELNEDQIAEYFHALSLGRKKLPSIELTLVDSKINQCQAR